MSNHMNFKCAFTWKPFLPITMTTMRIHFLKRLHNKDCKMIKPTTNNNGIIIKHPNVFTPCCSDIIITLNVYQGVLANKIQDNFKNTFYFLIWIEIKCKLSLKKLYFKSDWFRRGTDNHCRCHVFFYSNIYGRMRVVTACILNTSECANLLLNWQMLLFCCKLSNI